MSPAMPPPPGAAEPVFTCLPMNSPAATSKRRHRLWPWILGVALTPPVVLGLMIWSAFHLNREATALRQQVMLATGADWNTKVQFSAGPLLLSAVRAGVGCLHDVPPEARAALGAVRSASVGVYERRHPGAPVSRNHLLAAADQSMARRGWIRIVGVVDAGETVAIYLPAGGEDAAPSGVCLAVCSGGELVIVAARIEPEELAALAVQALGRQKLAGL